MNLLITGAWAEAEDYRAELEAMGHTVLTTPKEKTPLPCPYEWVEGTVCNVLFQYHPLEAFTNLRYIQLTSAGTDRVDVDAIARRGIELRNARGVYDIPMAEHAVWGVLSLYREGRFYERRREEHRWKKHRGERELFGKTVCVVGCGSVGTTCAEHFGAFGCRVIGLNRTIREDPAYERIFGMDAAADVLPEADVVILCLPIGPETRHWMDREKLALLKDGAILVNISRGAVADTEAVLEALPRLGGAVLDVHETEPLPEDSPLWDQEKLIITPHSSYVGEGDAARQAALFMKNLREYGT